MFRVPCPRLPARSAATLALLLVVGLAAGAEAKTYAIPHVFEKTGSVNGTPYTFDTSIFMTYTPGLAGGSPGTGTTTALYLYDETGRPMTSGTGEVICAPCMYANGTSGTTPRKVSIRVEDLIMAHGGYGAAATTKQGFAILEVTGDPDNLSMESRIEYSQETPGDISICPILPRDVLKDWFEPASARVFVMACFRDGAGNTASASTTDCFIHAAYTGGLGSVPAGTGATVELYLYDDSGAPMSGPTGPVCAPCTYALGTGLPTSASRWLEISIDGLTSTPMDKQGFGIIRVAGADPGAVALEYFEKDSHVPATHLSLIRYLFGIRGAPVPTVAVEQPDAPGAALMLRSAPNPATNAMTFDFELAHAANVDLDVFDAAGRRVATVYSGTRPAGRQELRWNRRDAAGNMLAAGIYYGRLKGSDGSRVTRLVFLP